MIKFFKVKGTEIRRAVEVNDAGVKVCAVAVIGKVADLLAADLIFEDNTSGNMDKWLVISMPTGASIREFDTLEEAKAAVKE